MASTAEADAKACTAEEQERKKQKPSYSIDDATALLKKHFNVPATAVKELDSYDDQNFRVTSPYGTYVLKAHNGVEARNTQLLDAQSQLLKHLEDHSIRAPVEAQSRVTLKRTTLRLLRWVDGDVLSSSTMTPSLLERAGSFLGDIRKALDGFDHEALHRLHLWDLRRFPAVTTFAAKLRSMDCDASRVKLVETCIENYSRQNFDDLPMATLHGDFNDANILLHGDKWGILDVGDCVHSWRVNDLAIGAAYVMVNLCTISASRGAAVHSRHRCDSCSSDEVVGGFFLDFEAIRTESMLRAGTRPMFLPRGAQRRAQLAGHGAGVVGFLAAAARTKTEA